jgi:hypothetical protein
MFQSPGLAKSHPILSFAGDPSSHFKKCELNVNLGEVKTGHPHQF